MNFLSTDIFLKLRTVNHKLAQWLAAEIPRWLSGKESACQCRRHRRSRFDPWVGKIPWRRKWQPTPVFLPGKFHEHRSLAGYTHEVAESDMTEQLGTHTHRLRNLSKLREQVSVRASLRPRPS